MDSRKFTTSRRSSLIKKSDPNIITIEANTQFSPAHTTWNGGRKYSHYPEICSLSTCISTFSMTQEQVLQIAQNLRQDWTLSFKRIVTDNKGKFEFLMLYHSSLLHFPSVLLYSLTWSISAFVVQKMYEKRTLDATYWRVKIIFNLNKLL